MGLVVVSIVIGLRCYTKIRITKTRGWEDCRLREKALLPLNLRSTDTAVLAFLVFVVYAAMHFVGAEYYGVGRHSSDVPPAFYNGYLTVSNISKLGIHNVDLSQTSAINTYCYVIGTMLAKLSLLLLLYRIFGINFKFRIACWTLGFVLVVWAVVTFLLMIFSCRPIQANWNILLYLDPKTHCFPKAYVLSDVFGYCNIITDFSLLFLPIPMMYKLQMNSRKKLSVGGVFATGSL